MPAQCSAENMIFVIFYGVGSGSQETARTEFYLVDGTLFAVTLFKGEATDFFILQPDNSIKRYKTIEELKGQTPCDTANKLYESQR